MKKRVPAEPFEPRRTLKESYQLAARLTGKRKKSVLIRLALEALIQQEVARKLIALGGTMPGLKLPRRRRPWQEHRTRQRKRTVAK